MTDCGTPAADRQSFENFGDENEQGDNQRREDFTDRQGCHDGDGHGKLHRHAALNDIFVGFLEDRETANDRTDYADTSYVGISCAAEKPNGPRCRSYEQDAVDLPPLSPCS